MVPLFALMAVATTPTCHPGTELVGLGKCRQADGTSWLDGHSSTTVHITDQACHDHMVATYGASAAGYAIYVYDPANPVGGGMPSETTCYVYTNAAGPAAGVSATTNMHCCAPPPSPSPSLQPPLSSLPSASPLQTVPYSLSGLPGYTSTWRGYKNGGCSVANNACPLLIMLHGSTENGAQFAEQAIPGGSRMHNIFQGIIAYPSATPEGHPPTRSNTTAWPANLQIIQGLIQMAGVDRARVYTVGFSAGGYWSYALMCAIGNQIAAQVIVGGLMEEQTTCLHRTNVLAIHNEHDGLNAPINPTPGEKGAQNGATIVQRGAPYDGPVHNGVLLPGIISYWLHAGTGCSGSNCNVPTGTLVPSSSSSPSKFTRWAAAIDGFTFDY